MTESFHQNLNPYEGTPLAEWQTEMERRGKLDCKFVCPNCGNVASPRDFLNAGSDAHNAPQECIGRVIGVFDDGRETPCNFAAYGLIPAPRRVLMPNGASISVFDFADD